jgi:capsular exopolysaccharide synthesis family protein
MSNELLPTVRDPGYNSQLQGWEEPRSQLPALARSPLERPVAAIRRYKWLLLGIVALSGAAGVAATRFVTAQYEVGSSFLIAADSPLESRNGPIRTAGLFSSDDWSGLLRSGKISDAVVRQLQLFIRPDNPTDMELFAKFDLTERFRPGKYELSIDRPRQRWTLTNQTTGVVTDSGAAGDTVGQRAGFAWDVPRWLFRGDGMKTVRFTASTPREAGVRLSGQLQTLRGQESSIMKATFRDVDPRRAARILNTWDREFLTVAADLKRRKLSLFATTLGDQLHTAKQSLDSAEVALSTFRVTTITQPGEGNAIAAGLKQTEDPVMKDYFQKTLEYENVKHDIRLLQSLIASVAKDSVPSDALLQIQSVASASATTQALREALATYHKAEADLVAGRVVFQDEHPEIRKLLQQTRTLKKETIPSLATDLLTILHTKAEDDSIRIASAGQNLQKIPQRTIEEERLTRNRDVAASLHKELQNRYAEAQLAEASATPDISQLDTAIAPFAPTKNTAPTLILGSIVAGIGAALALAILLDRLDGRVRYADQATDDLGLAIAGAVPRFPKGGIDQNSPEQVFQLLESFRSLRMAVMHSNGAGVAVAVSSPSPGDGKSLIAANLAMSFAESGLRTVLVDGDTRRGTLHDMFAMTHSPGLTDYLDGRASLLADVIRPTSEPNLMVVTSGTRRRRSPELLTSPKLREMVGALRSSFDVVIFDTPPLAVGIDGYSIATATGSLLVVLRVGKTNRRMAAEKLRMFERLPVDVIGAVLNGIKLEDGYQYYSYVPGYQAEDESPGTALAESNN